MNDILNRIGKDLTEYYGGRVSQSASQQVGWKSEAAQFNRFDQLIKVIKPGQFRINDYGCGQGDLASYLTRNGLVGFEYHGYDMLNTMINEAKVRYGSVPQCHFHLVEDPSGLLQSDYTVASGIFNLRFSINDAEWLSYMKEVIKVFDVKSTKGFAFNALTKYSDKELMKPELYYADPGDLFDFCKKNFSKNVALLHDYGEYDFTILVRKE